MNYAAIKKTDVANGPGVRVSLFVSGCTHGCKGCFNSEAWDFGYGNPYTVQTETEILKALAPDYIRGLSLLGGEPLDPRNRKEVLSLVEKVRLFLPEKRIFGAIRDMIMKRICCPWHSRGRKQSAPFSSLSMCLWMESLWRN